MCRHVYIINIASNFQVIYGRTHLGIALAFWDRYQYLDLSSPVYHNQFGYVSRYRQPVQDFTTALKPFTKLVWLAIATIALAVTLCFIALAILQKEKLSDQVKNEGFI